VKVLLAGFVEKSRVNTSVAVTWLRARKWLQELGVGVQERKRFKEIFVIRSFLACDFNYKNFHDANYVILF
jgi:hypothetical protein